MTADWQTCGEAGYGAYGSGSYEQAVAARYRGRRGLRAVPGVVHCGTVAGEDGRDSYGTDRAYHEHMVEILQGQADHFAGHGHEDARAAAQHLADYHHGKANE